MASKATTQAVTRAAKAAFLKDYGFSPRARCEVVEINQKSDCLFHVEISKWDGPYPEGNRVWDFYRVELISRTIAHARRL